MSNKEWVCQRCGKVGGFILVGKGFIMCGRCGAWCVVTASGKVNPVGESTPEFLPFIRGTKRLAG